MSSPDPQALHPIPGFASTVFLRPLLETKPGIGNIEVGDYSYYSDFDDPLPFFERNVRYNFGFSGARLSIGRYCALAHGTSFIMPDANHAMAGVSTYPFPVFGGAWAERMPIAEMPFPSKGDTVVGHDVWFGYEALVMPGVRIGHGAIIAARSVVTRDVPDYAVVAGNPARMIRRRFDEATIGRLIALAWWDWEQARVAEAIPHLVRGEIERLEAIAARREI
jgi:virginiamycin A acetyltransferase